MVGGDRAPFRVVLERGEQHSPVRDKGNRDLRRGDLVVVESCGGGGFGPWRSDRRSLSRATVERLHVEPSEEGCGVKLRDRLRSSPARPRAWEERSAPRCHGRAPHVVAAARDAGALEVLVEELRSRERRGQHLAVPTDMTAEEQVAALVHRTQSEFGRVDVLVNAAKVTGPVETPPTPWCF